MSHKVINFGCVEIGGRRGNALPGLFPRGPLQPWVCLPSPRPGEPETIDSGSYTECPCFWKTPGFFLLGGKGIVIIPIAVPTSISPGERADLRRSFRPVHFNPLVSAGPRALLGLREL